ncbi:uracil-DNA glycosylase family protein [Microbacterium sp. B2969]|uniref:Uracil-DNA glycosylase family protein n=1 Tax=Microbacterium alkaliflavum TaxID=3248839 RepID=A0ABW7QEG1_9MICO
MRRHPEFGARLDAHAGEDLVRSDRHVATVFRRRPRPPVPNLDSWHGRAGAPRGRSSRDDVYVTNAVKHFRFEPRGKRRIHEKPGVAHIEACHPRLEAEIHAVGPRVVVCLGATAARAVLGRTVRIGEERGMPFPLDDRIASVTTHPSALLRMRDRSERLAAEAALADDLRRAAQAARTA